MKNYVFRIIFGLFQFALWMPISVDAQYFGQNKPRYESFDFEVYQTPNFEIYHYLNDQPKLDELALWSEQWYQQHQAIFADSFSRQNPIVFYNNHAEFSQTNTISSQISIGTGGVTEAFKNRVILPIALSNQQTYHVLGHEMVHALQYNLILNGDSTSIQNLVNLPLWMVEGLAEYLSIGRVDAHTSMWMRDAVLNEDIPEIKDLSNPKYFPYRYGHAFWAFFTGLYGDDKIEPFFMATAKYGFEKACFQVLTVDSDALSKLWVEYLEAHYQTFLGDGKEKPQGRKLVDQESGGRINVAPVISPNGRYFIFLSEKDLFTTDLYLADARTGEILREISSLIKEGDVDDIDYIESAGSWSPDSKKFVYVTVEKGRNVLVVKEVLNGKTYREIRPEGLEAFQNPAWSPDGESIVVTGLKEGRSDLYLINVQDQSIRALTNDAYSELHPSWSPDGKYLVTATDRLSYGHERHYGKWTFSLAIIDMESGEITDLPIFEGADNVNPVFNNEGDILFLSNRDGFRNIYRYEIAEAKVYQETDVLTGVSGITQYAPALSATRTDKRNRVMYSRYFQNGYDIYLAKPEDFLNKEVAMDDIDMTAATMPRLNPRAPDLVQAYFENLTEEPVVSVETFEAKKYKPKFKLDYLGGAAGVGVSNSRFGTLSGASGGIDFLFSDMLGNNKLFASLSLNGSFTDFGGILAYQNNNGRIGWGTYVSHIPSRYGLASFGNIDSLLNSEGKPVPVIRDDYNILRVFTDEVGAFAQYPFNRHLRLESGLSYSFIYDRLDRISYYYDGFFYIGQEKTRMDPESLGFNVFEGQVLKGQVALVGDNSYFGVASPLKGYRFRFGANMFQNGFGEEVRNSGGANFYSLTADYRRYLYVKPFSLAFRGLHYGRYGKDSENFYPLYLGYPWYVRGYNSYKASEILAANGKSTADLLGSKLLVSNFEIRLPFTGPERLSLIRSNFFFTELALFADGGVAWNDYSEWGFGTGDGGGQGPDVTPFFSAGASLRINLFGALILEPYYAFPILKGTRGVFGLNFSPGW